MKKRRKKITNQVLVPEAYDLHLMEQIKAHLALAREIAQLATELRACAAHIEQTLRTATAEKIRHLPEELNQTRAGSRGLEMIPLLHVSRETS